VPAMAFRFKFNNFHSPTFVAWCLRSLSIRIIEPMSMQDASSTATAMSAVRRSVLVVDDELNFLLLLDRVLSKKGYEVKTATNGEQALSLIREQATFDLAIIDIRMDLMDGLSLLVELKQHLPHLKVIMLTAYPTYETRMTSIKKGASAYFSKPVELGTFLDAVSQLS
jgi:DNA-binding NtrC family response regulator